LLHLEGQSKNKRMKLKLYITLLTVVLFIENTYCQINKRDSLKPFNIEMKSGYGFIAPHNDGFNYFIQKHIPSFEIDISFPTNGDKLWEQQYRYPNLGLGYYHADLGNPEILGTVNALFGFIDVPWYRNNWFSVNYQFALGLSYLSKCYDYKQNYMNIAISTHLNVYLNTGINTKLRLTDRLSLITDLGLTHFSNGAVKVPNKGINVFSAQAGLSYRFGDQPIAKIEREIPKFEKKTEYSINLSMGIKQVYPIAGKNYFAYATTFYAERALAYKYKLGMGMDLFYDPSIKKNKEEEGIKNVATSDYFCPGFHLSGSFVFHRVSLTLSQGIYLFNKPINFQKTYNRYGFRYRLSKHTNVNLSLKSYFASADNIEWGLGYIF